MIGVVVRKPELSLPSPFRPILWRLLLQQMRHFHRICVRFPDREKLVRATLKLTGTAIQNRKLEQQFLLIVSEAYDFFLRRCR